MSLIAEQLPTVRAQQGTKRLVCNNKHQKRKIRH